MLSAVHAVVVCLSVRLSVPLQIVPHDRPETLFLMGCFVSCRISTDKRVARSLCHSRATCFYYQAQVTSGMYPKWPIICRVGHKPELNWFYWSLYKCTCWLPFNYKGMCLIVSHFVIRSLSFIGVLWVEQLLCKDGMGSSMYIGNNCEKCYARYYRPSDVDPSSLSPCVPCNCSGPGVASDELDTEPGDCVVNDETALSLPGMVSWFVHFSIVWATKTVPYVVRCLCFSPLLVTTLK